MSGEKSIQFSLVSGGPFHKMLARFGLLGPDWLPTWRIAFVLALLAWSWFSFYFVSTVSVSGWADLSVRFNAGAEPVPLPGVNETALVCQAGLIRPASWPVYSE